VNYENYIIGDVKGITMSAGLERSVKVVVTAAEFVTG
jgi:hypothetical protein